MQTQSAQRQPSYRWVILVAMCIVGFMTIGTRSTVSSFLKTIVVDLQSNRAMLSLIVAVNIWLSGLLQPFAGRIMDRFGARWLFASSVALYGVGIGLMNLTPGGNTPIHLTVNMPGVGLISLTFGELYLLIIYGIVVGAASSGASMSLANALVAQWFKDWRALAMGINNAGGALGTLLLVGTMSPWLLSSFGWRLSHAYLGLAVLIIAVPMTLLIPRRRAESAGGPTTGWTATSCEWSTRDTAPG